eukprot:CAMPEP_0202692720 /NCGR_PEP_ID=MMETSP1385-20130828/7028_1 /ASSEMBLY_ACC=CAM_ASM_000861 /TAXON_ID=933848 /ORGANISM="Elphidium margaritaceum" /LENGTH=806 /DNA_ID=CAMNT_0049348301 /DNA_START=27 /DNA_END=2450 /DNA_ORIENTATION=-
MASFEYGFTVHSLSQVNSATKQSSPKKSAKKASGNKARNAKPSAAESEVSSSPLSSMITISNVGLELYSSSVTRLLDDDHLRGSNATSLHDLQCGTGTTALQAFVSCPHLRRVLGVEQNKNLFHWATQNMMALIKNGYQNNTYLLVENIPSVKMTIAQKLPAQQLDSVSFAVNDAVFAFVPLKDGNIKKRDNYQGVVRAVHADGIHYDVEMGATKTVIKNVHKESIFKPGTERTFEVIRGNLFERSDSFRSDVILLPYAISNDSLRSLLLTGCKRSPIGARILSFAQLESWDGFPAYQLRRIDANVYDCDRYDTNLSAYQKLYLYQHVLSPKMASSPRDIALHCRVGAEVTVRDARRQQWFSAIVIAVNAATKTVTVNKDGFIGDTGIEELKMDEQRIHLLQRRFGVGDLITAYCPKLIDMEDAAMYTLYRAQVMAIEKGGTYEIQYEDGEVFRGMDEVYMFAYEAAKVHAFGEGQLCLAMRYDAVSEVNEEGELVNVKEQYAAGDIGRETCVIRHVNPSGTYRVLFLQEPSEPYHDAFTEQWLTSKTLFEEKTENAGGGDDSKTGASGGGGNIIRAADVKLPLALEIDYDRALEWRPNIVARWFEKCGVCSPQLQRSIVEYNVNGVFLLDLDFELLTQDMQLTAVDAQRVLAYIAALQKKLKFRGDPVQERVAEISTMMQGYARECELLQQRQKLVEQQLNALVAQHQADYNRLKEYQLRMQCKRFAREKKSSKEIAQQLHKDMKWVNTTIKMKANQIKKPNASVIKDIEALQIEIAKVDKDITEKQTRIVTCKQQLQQLTVDRR